MQTDQHFEGIKEINGQKVEFKRISNDRVTGVDDTGHQGIDGVYENSHPPPQYIINETKFGSSELNPKTVDGPQMGDKWVKNRLDNAVGEDTADDIRLDMQTNPTNVQKVLTKVDANGNVSTYKIDANGKVTGPWP